MPLIAPGLPGSSTVLPFTRESLATIRRRVGKLIGVLEWGQLSAGAAGSFTAEFVKKYPDNGKPLVGAMAYIVSGTGAGQNRVVTSSTQATGVAPIAPNWGITPDATSIIEVWSGGLDIDTVNNAINLAIMDAQEVAWVPDRVNPASFDSTNLDNLTLPSNLIAISRVVAQNVSSRVWITYQLGSDPAWLDEHPQTAVLVGNTLFLSPKLTSSFPITNIWIVGYRPPTPLVLDTDLAEVRSDFLVYKAAVLLESRNAGGSSVDPEEHGGRAANWEREALAIRATLSTPFDPDTQLVHP